jgi:predicted secreted protein
MKKIILSIVCVSSLSLAACAAKMPANYTPITKQQYVLTDVVNGIGTLQMAAENAVPAKYLSNNSARVVVQFCVDANYAIGQSPNGWYAVVSVTYQAAKNQLTADEQQKFGGYLLAFEVVLNSFAPAVPAKV